MTQASSKIMICASVDAIWQAISDFGAAGRRLVGVVQCTVKGEGVGALRTLTSVDGSTVVERLETLDEAEQQLSYALLTNTPFGRCLTTMAVRALDPYPHQAELLWSADFESVGIPSSEAADLLQSSLAANCHALKQFLEVG